MSDLIKGLNDLVTDIDEQGRFMITWSVAGLAFAGLGGLIARRFGPGEAAPVSEDGPSQHRRRAAQSGAIREDRAAATRE